MIFLPTHDSSNCGNDFELLIPIPVTIPIPNTSLDSRICMRGTNQQGDYLPTVSIGFNGRVRHHTQKDQQKEQKKKILHSPSSLHIYIHLLWNHA